jgi:hypothetical protein
LGREREEINVEEEEKDLRKNEEFEYKEKTILKIILYCI